MPYLTTIFICLYVISLLDCMTAQPSPPAIYCENYPSFRNCESAIHLCSHLLVGQLNVSYPKASSHLSHENIREKHPHVKQIWVVTQLGRKYNQKKILDTFSSNNVDGVFWSGAYNSRDEEYKFLCHLKMKGTSKLDIFVRDVYFLTKNRPNMDEFYGMADYVVLYNYDIPPIVCSSSVTTSKSVAKSTYNILTQGIDRKKILLSIKDIFLDGIFIMNKRGLNITWTFDESLFIKVNSTHYTLGSPSKEGKSNSPLDAAANVGSTKAGKSGGSSKIVQKSGSSRANKNNGSSKLNIRGDSKLYEKKIFKETGIVYFKTVDTATVIIDNKTFKPFLTKLLQNSFGGFSFDLEPVGKLEGAQWYKDKESCNIFYTPILKMIQEAQIEGEYQKIGVTELQELQKTKPAKYFYNRMRN